MALLERLRLRLRHRWEALKWAMRQEPIAGAEEPDAADPKKTDVPDPDAKKTDPKKTDVPDPDDDDDDKVTPTDDWQAKSRKHERAAKRERKKREEAEQKLKDAADAGKDDQQKAIDKAKEEARTEALTEAEKERRSDRLEVSVTRMAAKGVTVGEGDDAKTLKFDDPEDALVFIEREIARGDLDEEDVYDKDNKVQSDVVEEALVALLKRKPKLAADAEGRTPAGDPDTRKGDPAKNDLESMTPEDHAKRKYGTGDKK